MMGSCKEVEIRELVGMHILSTLSKSYCKGSIGLWKYDRLVVLNSRSIPEIE